MAKPIEVTPHVSPTEVKGKIVEALRDEAGIDARRIRVESHDSTVTPTGVCAPNWRRRSPNRPGSE